MKDFATITYTDSRGNVFDLMAHDIHWINSADGFHSYEWEPESTEKRFGEKLRSWKKKAKNLNMTIIFYGSDNERVKMLNEFHDSLEYDITKFSPGTITWEEYSIQGYCISSKTAPVSKSELFNATGNEITFYCPNPFWVKMLEYKEYASTDSQYIDVYIVPGSIPYTAGWFSEEEHGTPLTPQANFIYTVKTPGEFFEKSFAWVSDEYVDLTASGFEKTYEDDGFNYAYDYMYDFNPERAGIINNDNILGSKYIMTIYGPVYGDGQSEGGPFVIIRNAVTQKDVTVSFPGFNIPAGARLVVDSRDKTTIMTTSVWEPEKQDYQKINAFGQRDLDYYLWDTVDYGQNSVIINGNYRVQLQLYEERSEPKWLTD